MKTIIVSDTHDNLINFQEMIFWAKNNKVRILIHCGDIFSPMTLKTAIKNFSGKSYIVLSDVDRDYFKIDKDLFEDFYQLKVWEEFGEIKIDAKKIAFTHFPEFAKGLATTGKYDLVFYGHNHKPWLEKIGKTKLVNPGNLSGLFYKPTFALYDTKTNKLELKILENLK